MTTIEDFLLHCLAQKGDRYVFGVEVAPDNLDPVAFDCSELVQWAAARSGISPTVPDGSWYQAQHCRRYGTLVDINTGINTRGALLFRFVGDPWGRSRPSAAHVAISLGDGTTIEARGTKWGVGTWTAVNRGWTHAGLIPGVNYSPTIPIGDLVATVVDPQPGNTGGKVPFWAVHASGHVFPRNGARVPTIDVSTLNLNEPIDGAAYHAGHLVLIASRDTGTFSLPLKATT